MGSDPPQEPLAQSDEGRHVLDTIGVEMLQLEVMVVQQPPKKLMQGNREAMLVE